jgi:hypothetical protein
MNMDDRRAPTDQTHDERSRVMQQRQHGTVGPLRALRKPTVADQILFGAKPKKKPRMTWCLAPYRNRAHFSTARRINAVTTARQVRGNARSTDMIRTCSPRKTTATARQ